MSRPRRPPILLTGATGYVGGRLRRVLEERGVGALPDPPPRGRRRSPRHDDDHHRRRPRARVPAPGDVRGRDGVLPRSVDDLGDEFIAGYLLGGSWQRGFEAMIWAGLVRIFLFQQVTFSINSICHFFGEQPLRTRDESRNVWLLPVVRRVVAQRAPRAPGLGSPRPGAPARHFGVCDPWHGEAPPRDRGQAPRLTSDRPTASRG